MPNITRGDRMDGLVRYLVGPGRENEHTEPHLVAGSPSIMAWFDDAELSEEAALQIAKELDHPYRTYGTEPHGGHVWHCSLSLKAEEGQLGDERWAEIAEAFMERMGFLDEGKAPVRWVGIHHGLSKAGNDHIHLAVELVREDGTKASTWNDQPRAQAAARAIEQQFGLQVVEGRGIGMGERGRKPRDVPHPGKGQPRPQVAETPRERLERVVRAVASTSETEAEFVRGARAAGLLARPRFATGTQDVVVGYSVAQRPPRGEKPLWFGGGKLARDLTLPRLREGWPDTPQHASDAVREWQAAWRNKRPTVRVRDHRPRMDPEVWTRYAEEVSGLREQLRTVSPGDVGTWSAVAHQLAGAFSAWSLAAEGDRPGPLASTASTLARTAQVRRGFDDQGARDQWGPSIRGLSLILASAAKGGRGPVGMAVLLRQLANTAKALHDAHLAAGREQEARRIATAVLTDLEQVRQSLPSPQLRQLADQRATEAGQVVGGGRPRTPGSPVPEHLQAHRPTQRTGGQDHGR